MRSLLVEFYRTEPLETGILQKGRDYLRVAASHPVCKVEGPIASSDFVNKMRPLRYETTDAAARIEALREFGETTAKLLQLGELDELKTGEFPLQLDLVVNAAELASLPFESTLDSKGQPLFVKSDNPIVLTRRVRGDFAENLTRWPAQVRVLFAWAWPAREELTNEVPYEEHSAELRKALAPWLPPDAPGGPAPNISDRLQILGEASLESLRDACNRAVAEKKPFTHVHLLGHGLLVGESPEEVFGLALHAYQHSDDKRVATPEDIADALSTLRGKTGVLSLCICDSANSTNASIARRSIAHELHAAGFPVVVASQFPLTLQGSIVFVRKFYGDLLNGSDVRLAIHNARLALYENSKIEKDADWASLVCYVRLPEGYSEHLPSVRLEAELASLRAAQSWSDELINSALKGEDGKFDHVAKILRASVGRLDAFSQAHDMPSSALPETLGLLGSAEKRWAELQFERATRTRDKQWAGPIREALSRARDWYKKASDSNLSAHWPAVQHLSLDAVLEGKIREPGRWHAAVLAAKLGDKGEDAVWAWGSLAEAYLLAPLAGQASEMEKALESIRKIKERSAKPMTADHFPLEPLESTRRQIRRYVTWWTHSNGFFPGQPFDLSSHGSDLLRELL